MLLMQQSSSFRLWTSRALMVYFRRALLFLVVSPRQNRNHNICLPPQRQQRIDFSDAEDDEDILLMDENKSSCEGNQDYVNRIEISQSKYSLLNDYGYKRLSQAVNNSMIKSTIDSLLIESMDQSSLKVTLPGSLFTDQLSRIFTSIQPAMTEQFETFTDRSDRAVNSFSVMNNIENTARDVFAHEHQQIPEKYHDYIQSPLTHNQYVDVENPIRSYPMTLIHEKKTLHSCLPSFVLCHSSNDETSSSESNKLSLSTSVRHSTSHLPTDEDDSYEKYQTSFSLFLHQTKSLDTIRNEDRLESMLVLEPNTSIVTVHQLTYHSFHPNNINHLLITSEICIHLIAHRADLTVQCDAKPIGCKKALLNTTSTNTTEQEKSNQRSSAMIVRKHFQSTSIMIDLPYKILFIDL